MRKEANTIVIMVSVGDREHLTKFTYPRLAAWAAKHHYSSCLLKKPYQSDLDRSLHFTKLMAHKILPGFERYIIIDDDLLLRTDAPEMEEVPEGYVGLCMDAVQVNTAATHVKWTGNTGFIVCDRSALKFLEQAYYEGEYQPLDPSQTIWGPFDQAILNHILFKNDRVYQLDWRWNYQCVIDYYDKTIGWHNWKNKRWERLLYYLKIGLPLSSRAKKKITQAYGIHMTMGLYPKFFSKIHA